jgi:hypothetical protein
LGAEKQVAEKASNLRLEVKGKRGRIPPDFESPLTSNL